MRIALAALPLMLAATPALAQPRHAAARPTPEQAAAALGNPLVQEAAARALTQLIGIVLDTRVGPAAAALAPDDGYRPDTTLRDVVRRDDPRFEEHFYETTRRSLATGARAAGAAVAQGRELERTADRLDAALAPLIGALRDSSAGY